MSSKFEPPSFGNQIETGRHASCGFSQTEILKAAIRVGHGFELVTRTPFDVFTSHPSPEDLANTLFHLDNNHGTKWVAKRPSLLGEYDIRSTSALRFTAPPMEAVAGMLAAEAERSEIESEAAAGIETEQPRRPRRL